MDTHLFQAFIPAAYTPDNPRPPPRWTAEQAHRTVVFLAQFLQNQRGSTPDLAWWELPQALPARTRYDSLAYERKRRAGDLAEWHGMLLERLADYDAADRLTRLAAHSALAGAESLLFQARPAWRDGEADRARALVGEALTELPGHQELHTFAAEIGAPLTVRAQEAAGRLSR
ncbi:hypothetical protein [Actinacidiphila oryziradicis]|uniref:Uncharacterized protein n=1 Tax=Actinacidiphila oryziradicis TaxID=2571141 RepID=A0A4U0RU48_9ACTN|nr:hypothetical protein [Actinacidiphila oryziradicis]TJZ99665.1 hypothetical protein FCI23_44875 [Actinacidiphila oryziradicis]